MPSIPFKYFAFAFSLMTLSGCFQLPCSDSSDGPPIDLQVSNGDYDEKIVITWTSLSSEDIYTVSKTTMDRGSYDEWFGADDDLDILVVKDSQYFRENYYYEAGVGEMITIIDHDVKPGITYYYWVDASRGCAVSDAVKASGYAGALTDTLLKHQWPLINKGQSAFSDQHGTSGEDLSVGNVYSNGFKGRGSVVAVLDTGIEFDHEDLKSNIDPSQQIDFSHGKIPPDSIVGHGTAIAGLIAAEGWNNLGARGVAPEATLKSFNLMSHYSIGNEIVALGGGNHPSTSNVDIYNRSYGNIETDDVPIDPLIEAQLRMGVTQLRDGKGAIYVKSSGNGYTELGNAYCRYANEAGLPCQNANLDADNTIPWQIVVGAVNANGVRSSYSTPGSALWVTAPGGESGLSESMGWDSSVIPVSEFGPALLTTDLTGCDRGYSRISDDVTPFNPFENNQNGLNRGCKYTSTFTGTSAAAPLVSGAIAVMLSANPDLTWRDVRHILAVTSDKVDSAQSGIVVKLGDGSYQADQGWVENGAGFSFHNWYGFGRVNLTRAVSMAQSFNATFGKLEETPWYDSGALELTIPDYQKTGVSHSVSVVENMTIEAVQIKVSVDHIYSGDLGVELTSPSGTTSILLNIYNGMGSSDDLSEMVLLSNAFYGESSYGQWTIKLLDGNENYTGSFRGWKIKAFGH